MDGTDRTWLENRLHAAVDDDFYLDRDEEKRIKEEGASRGIGIREIETTIQAELKESGSVSERQLLDEFERMLHQFTDDDKLLDAKEERDAFDHVVQPAAGKRKGLDARVAEDYVASFCKVNGVRRSSDRRSSPALMIGGVAALLAIALLAFLLLHGNGGGTLASPAAHSLTAADRSEVDAHIRQADQYVQQAQYTDPPEQSAKAELDEIAQIDPTAAYRADDVNAIKRRIVDHYLTLAERSARAHDANDARRWLGRARLMKTDSEGIEEKARSIGLAD